MRNHARCISRWIPAKICEQMYKFTKRVVELDGMLGFIAIPTQDEKKEATAGIIFNKKKS